MGWKVDLKHLSIWFRRILSRQDMGYHCNARLVPLGQKSNFQFCTDNGFSMFLQVKIFSLLVLWNKIFLMYGLNGPTPFWNISCHYFKQRTNLPAMNPVSISLCISPLGAHTSSDKSYKQFLPKENLKSLNEIFHHWMLQEYNTLSDIIVGRFLRISR